jgi:hypothetical protein
MSIRPIPLTEAQPAQLRDYARSFLQLEVTAEDSDSSVMSKIKAAQPDAVTIFVNEPDTPEEVVAAETAGEVPLRPEEESGRMVAGLGQGDPRAVIEIPQIETEDGSGSRDVLVGVNGRAWQLQRGQRLPVPWRVVEALRNAKATIVRHSSEEGREGEVLTHDAARVGFQILEQPSAAEIAAWHERTDAMFCA